MLIKQDDSHYIKASKREQAFWDKSGGGENKGSPFEKEYLNFHKTGNAKTHYLEYLQSLGKRKNGLSIGGGFGEEELAILTEGIVDHLSFIDFSEGSNAILEQNSKKLDVQDRVSIINGDLNFITLKENSYDFIICRNVLHHIINLEECLFELTKSLTSNGILVIDDFIGENKFQRTEERMQAISNFQKTVKERYNIVSPSYCRTNSKVLTNNCPFEAIRSEDVYDVVQYYFGKEIIYEKKYGYLWENHKSFYTGSEDIFFTLLPEYEIEIEESSIFPAPRLFGIYGKSSQKLLPTNVWSQKEVKERIGLSLISERGFMSIATQLQKTFPSIYIFLKKIYFMIRR